MTPLGFRGISKPITELRPEGFERSTGAEVRSITPTRSVLSIELDNPNPTLGRAVFMAGVRASGEKGPSRLFNSSPVDPWATTPTHNEMLSQATKNGISDLFGRARGFFLGVQAFFGELAPRSWTAEN